MSSVAGAGTEQVEAQALVVDALGVAAGLVLRDRQDLAPELTDSCRSRLDVLDPEVQPHLWVALSSWIPPGGVIEEMWNEPG